uniref:Fungal_trans domain-containing protein n=1 Tax=Echinostoma caproni TaxID=27848 RepID=A0A183AYJ4_9TREM
LADGKSFDFSPANWLYLSNGALFSDLPFVRMRDERQQTELEVEWELFVASRHFDPIRLLSLICSWEARLSMALLTQDTFTSPTDPDDLDSAVRVMASLFRVCSRIPGLEMFHTNVITSLQTAIWLRFKQLVDWHANEDDALSSGALTGTENPVEFLDQYRPRTRAFWSHLISGGRLSCGCDLPQPPSLDPAAPLGCCTASSSTVDTAQEHVNSALAARKKAAYDRWHEELHRGSPTWYLLRSGCHTLSWHEFACDLIQLGVTDVPVGIQLALANLDDMAAHQMSPLRGGDLMWLYIVLLSLSDRIVREFSENPKHRVRHAILLEYLIRVLESTQDDEIFKCKKRLQSHLENMKASQWSYPEYVGHSSSGRAFHLSQIVRQIQKYGKSLNRFVLYHLIHRNSGRLCQWFCVSRLSGLFFFVRMCACNLESRAYSRYRFTV